MSLVLTHNRNDGVRIITPVDSIDVIVRSIKSRRDTNGREIKQACIEVSDSRLTRFVNLTHLDPPYYIREDFSIFISNRSRSRDQVPICYQGPRDKYDINRI